MTEINSEEQTATTRERFLRFWDAILLPHLTHLSEHQQFEAMQKAWTEWRKET